MTGLESLWLRGLQGQLPLVAGRECGACTVCCIWPTIDVPQMQKLAGTVCRNCDNGCAIHPTRPQVCRDYFCAWRQLEFLDESWRPDNSDVVLQFIRQDGVAGLSFMVRGDPRTTVRQTRFLALVMEALRLQVPLWLVLEGPRGHDGIQALLNGGDAMAATPEASGVQAMLVEIVEELLRHGWMPRPLVNSGNDVSGP